MIQLELVHSLPLEEFLLTRCVFSPDGASLAVGHKQFQTYDAETGTARASFSFPELLAQLVYSPDGRFLAAANVGDNHPSTRGRVALFEASSGVLLWDAGAAQAVETCAFRSGNPLSLFWNAGSAISGSDCQPPSELAAVSLPQFQLRALACSPHGFVCFGREAQGSVRQVEGADLVFRKFRVLSLDADGALRRDFDLGIGAGVHVLSPDGRLLAAEMVDFKNNERHVSLIDVETGVEANLLQLEANTLPVLAFGSGSEFLLCMKEDAEANYNLIRLWRTSDLKLIGEVQVDLGFHALATCLEHSLIACLGSGRLDTFALT
ncbi:MAG: WD40 repeat domain-containing protein [Terriglobales bacterium]